jgi:RsiW-degrading membrane proteinase PrsW (M82 family)
VFRARFAAGIPTTAVDAAKHFRIAARSLNSGVLQITAAATLVPSILLMWYFHSRDAYPEPPRVLWATFGLGVLIVIPVLAVALPTIAFTHALTHPHATGLASAFLSAAIPEELFKFLVLWVYCARHREFNEPIDGIVYGVAGSLGFATLENVLYVSSGGLVVAIMRAFTAVPGHAFLGAIMGYYVGRAKFEPEKKGALVLAALGIPILLHGLYDYPLLAMSAQVKAWGGEVPPGGGGVVLGMILIALAVLIAEAVWAIGAARKLRHAQRMAGPPAGAVAMPVAPAYPARPDTTMAWLAIVGGGILACGGGFLLLATVIGAVVTKDGSMLPALGCVGLVFGVVPLAAGAALFWWGMKSLNRAGV